MAAEESRQFQRAGNIQESGALGNPVFHGADPGGIFKDGFDRRSA